MHVGLAPVLVVVAAAAVPVSRWRTGDYFTPAALVAAVWCGTLGLHFLRFLPYPPMRPGTLGSRASVCGRCRAKSRARPQSPRPIR
jgi:hypothetical protein